MKCWLFLITSIVRELKLRQKTIKYRETSTHGCHPRIHQRTTTLLVKLTMTELQSGSFKELPLGNGKRQVHYFGSMENVRFQCPTCFFLF